MAFRGTSLTSITIPDSLTMIGQNVFFDCSDLITVVIKNATITNILFANSFTNVSTNPNSKIIFENVSNSNELSATWKTISGYYATQVYEPTISFPNINVTYGNAPQTIVYTSDSTGLVTFTSSNESVATINGSEITFVGAGTCDITLSQEATTNYLAGTSQSICTVSNNVSAPTINFPNLNVVYGTASQQIFYESNSTGSVTFESSDVSVATIIGKEINFVGAGTCDITLLQEATDDYLAGMSVATYTVSKVNPPISFPNINVVYGNAPQTIVYTSDSTGLVTFTSSNESVATIIGREITFVGAGTCEITLLQSETLNYFEGTSVALCSVLENTSENPTYINESSDLIYYLSESTAVYANLNDSINVTVPLIANGGKVITSDANVIIIKSTEN